MTTSISTLTRRVSVGAVALLTVAACSSSSEKDAEAEEPTALTSQEVFDLAKDGTVLIYGRKGESVSRGTGWVVDKENGYVVTNAHVAVGLSAMKAKVGDETVAAQLVGAAPCQDVAVIKLTTVPDKAKELKIGDSTSVQNQDAVVSLGFPLQGSTEETEGDYANISMTSSSGVVENPSTNADLGPSSPVLDLTIQHSANINSGSSGGPLLNDKGEVIGMNSAGQSSANLNYAIASSRVQDLLPSLQEGENPAYTGMDLVAGEEFDFTEYADLIPEYDASMVNGLFADGSLTGLIVTGVDPGSPAEEAEMTAGDLLTDLNGTPVRTVQEVCDILGSVAPGATVGMNGAYFLNAVSNAQELGAAFTTEMVMVAPE